MLLKPAVVKDDRYLDHKTGHIHPEHPNRLASVYRMLVADFSGMLLNIHPEPVPLEYLELVHTPLYIEKVLSTANRHFTNLAPDTPVSGKTYLAAWLAVGGCLRGLDALISGECDVCFSLVRPPGHHALPDRASGFCIFNNLGITARYAMTHYGFQRILIVDWDVHHGNGIQDLFYEEKSVLYFSSHDPLLYPYTGDWYDTGTGKGEGYTINIPIPRELEDNDILYLYQTVLGDVVRAYQPELILVAAGFDAHHNDPIGKSRFTSKVFRGLTTLILELREKADKPPVLFALEGGYNSRALASSVKEVFKAMTYTGKSGFLIQKTPQGEKLIQHLRDVHAKYRVWT